MNASRIVVAIGNGVIAPESRGPSQAARPVTASTSTTAATMRSGRSQAGAGAGIGASGNGGSVKGAMAKAASASASPEAAVQVTAWSATVRTAKAVQPTSTQTHHDRATAVHA